MIPPFVPYIPLKHPEDLLPIESTHRTMSNPDIWVEWFEKDAQPASNTRAISILGKLANWLAPLRIHRRKKTLMIEREIRC